MKITLCGSIAFYDRMQDLERDLCGYGHEVKLPPGQIQAEDGTWMPVYKYYELRKTAKIDDHWIWKKKAEAMRNHFEKVVWSDAILVVNEPKNKIDGYVGANTLMEMGLAFHLQKTIYLLHPIPDQSYTEEIYGMHPIVIQGDLARIPCAIHSSMSSSFS
ncbi:MAG TPA: hypothetical protein VFQ60_02625 [Patescibacteria group bacterium]|nr:hypothetical protein [Patescibacteria group bacterium]